MGYKNKKLQLKQVDEQLIKIRDSGLEVPHKGWINTIRKAISMSSAQLGNKLGISHQGAFNLEKREALGTITINKLQEVGRGFKLKLVYGFVPINSSLQEMVEQRARELAKEIVMNTSQHMSLEDQKITNEKLKESVKERTEEIMRTMPKYLWD
tara:strand:- start:691 stop:1152 length:462 start_codon:yes stop_codon:yes gene_type:complete